MPHRRKKAKPDAAPIAPTAEPTKPPKCAWAEIPAPKPVTIQRPTLALARPRILSTAPPESPQLPKRAWVPTPKPTPFVIQRPAAQRIRGPRTTQEQVSSGPENELEERIVSTFSIRKQYYDLSYPRYEIPPNAGLTPPPSPDNNREFSEHFLGILHLRWYAVTIAIEALDIYCWEAFSTTPDYRHFFTDCKPQASNLGIS
ncbi:hypothetical protein B0H17DRAFT_1036097 [Mycena rosella]|uniref:Uncharacterized protein n=1 Tax=Mycena rosella TaxID=1033263 RepID=A0AAD7M8T1_MYCRO|nr:hypothetical protein B0H17DRAFT_1036097 [Mycena rosella]